MLAPEVQAAQVAAHDPVAAPLQPRAQAAPAAGEVQHQAARGKGQQGCQAGAFQEGLLLLAAVDLEVERVVEVPGEPFHGNSLAQDGTFTKRKSGRDRACSLRAVEGEGPEQRHLPGLAHGLGLPDLAPEAVTRVRDGQVGAGGQAHSAVHACWVLAGDAVAAAAQVAPELAHLLVPAIGPPAAGVEGVARHDQGCVIPDPVLVAGIAGLAADQPGQVLPLDADDLRPEGERPGGAHRAAAGPEVEAHGDGNLLGLRRPGEGRSVVGPGLEAGSGSGEGDEGEDDGGVDHLLVHNSSLGDGKPVCGEAAPLRAGMGGTGALGVRSGRPHGRGAGRLDRGNSGRRQHKRASAAREAPWIRS